MASTFNVISETVNVYVDALRANNNGRLSRVEITELLAIPTLAAAFAVWFTDGKLESSAISNLITIFGIFASVLVTSFAPMIDFKSLLIGNPQVSNDDLTDSEQKVNIAVQTARDYLFAFNCMSLFLSLISICLLLLLPFFSFLRESLPVLPSNWIGMVIGQFATYAYPTISFWIMSAALFNVAKTLQVVIKLFGGSSLIHKT